MSPMGIACIVFACVFGGALLGMSIRAALPEHHLSPDSQNAVKMGSGLIATMAALVLGLVIASAKSSFDTQNAEIKQSGVNALLLDRVLAQYGPETRTVRDGLRQTIAYWLQVTWPEDSTRAPRADLPETAPRIEALDEGIRTLSPQTDSQRTLQSHALQISADLQQTGWSLTESSGGSVPGAFLIVLVFWLTVVFATFGLLAPRNRTVLGVLLLCALSVSGSIFLILEMDQPFEGLLKISSAPLRYTLSHLGR